jgi:protein-S-isoprenylcysteine O-methyltransferase Ste14
MGEFFFKYRSYTPIPFLVMLFLWGRPTVLTLVIGFIIAMSGELLRIWAVSYAGSETRTTKLGASVLVTQGPYAYIRNPLYAGNLFIYAGVSIMANSLFPYLLIIGIVYFYLQYFFIIRDEERFLSEKFKDKYADYESRVNKFIPKLTPYDEQKQSKLKFDLKAGYRSEKRTFQALTSIMLMIVLIFVLLHWWDMTGMNTWQVGIKNIR